MLHIKIGFFSSPFSWSSMKQIDLCWDKLTWFRNKSTSGFNVTCSTYIIIMLCPVSWLTSFIVYSTLISTINANLFLFSSTSLSYQLCMAVSFNHYCHGLYGNPLFFILSCFENTDAVFVNNCYFFSLACLKKRRQALHVIAVKCKTRVTKKEGHSLVYLFVLFRYY